MFEMHTISYCIAAVYLLVGTGMDVRVQKIPKWYLLAGTAAVVIFRLCIQEYKGTDYFIGGTAGILFGLISFLTKEQFGYGDSWMIGILGVFFGIRQLVTVLFLTFLTSAVAAGYCMIGKKCDKHKAIPFYPFLCLGFIGGILL